MNFEDRIVDKRKPTKPDFDLSEQALNINVALTEIAHSSIKKNNDALSFSQFMQTALYEPKLGYYQNNLQTFGEQGDFVTAPEISRLFAGGIANSIANYLDNNQKQSILEVGAGSGRLALNILRFLEAQNQLPNQYFILEPSSALQFQQKELLASFNSDYLNRVTWLSNLPHKFDGIIIANEVIDAIPFDRIMKQKDGWYFLLVASEKEGFVERIGNKVPKNRLPVALQEKNRYPEGYKAEIRSLAKGWIKALYESINRGAVLLIDYGYPQKELYHPQRVAGSLKCFINHHQHDNPLQYIGLQDITAHVDFTDIAVSADDYGFEVAGFTTQAGFLLENGIMDLAQQESQSANDDAAGAKSYSMSRDIQKLLMPGQMGEIIKVMLLEKEPERLIKGFSLQDHLHRL